MPVHQRPGFWYPVESAPYDNSVPNTPIGTYALMSLPFLSRVTIPKFWEAVPE